MSDSTSLLDLIVQSQSAKEVTANALFDAASPATLFARRDLLCVNLDWFYYGGMLSVSGVPTAIPNNTAALVLTANATNYIEATPAGVVSRNVVGFTAGYIPLYVAVCGPTSVVSWADKRAWVQPAHVTSKVSVAVTAADVTLTQAQAACRYLTTTGAITGANRNVIVPNDWEGIVYCNNTGAFTTTFKTSGGSGVVVAQTKRAHLLADGTNVVRITADT